MKIGVLALQGDFREHRISLEKLGADVTEVRLPEHLEGLQGLIIPGGESTAIGKLMVAYDLLEPLRVFGRTRAIWGTCAGAILLARENAGETPFFGLIDITVSRNAFGSQMDSFNCEALAPAVAREPIPLTFIRAPKILRAGPGVRVLLELDGYIAAAEDDRALVTIFHPELTPSLAFHRYFARKCGLRVAEADDAALDPAWTPQSWTRFSYHS